MQVQEIGEAGKKSDHYPRKSFSINFVNFINFKLKKEASAHKFELW